MAETLLDGRMKDLKRAAVRELMATEAVDITLPGARPQIGDAHLINQIIEEIEDVFCGIGYTVEAGPQVESSWYNFTALERPARSPEPFRTRHLLREGQRPRYRGASRGTCPRRVRRDLLRTQTSACRCTPWIPRSCPFR